MSDSQNIPHMNIVIGASVLGILGYLGFSVYIVGVSKDPALMGDVVGTWKSFAVAAFAFWIGSSSGGKMREEKSKEHPPVEERKDE